MFQVLISHVCLVAAVLDSASLELERQRLSIWFIDSEKKLSKV